MKNRVIKFRAWDKEKREMLAGFSLIDILNNSDTGYFTPDGSWDNFFNLSDAIVMQFTGLLDKNGKEIYESDICKLPGQGFVPFEVKLPELWKWLEGDLSDCEVIGNTYENPELLK